MISTKTKGSRYDEFVKNESFFSIKYLKNKQILDERFDKSEYNFLVPIFSDSNLIDQICFVIDDLLSTLRLDVELRYLVLGDFLFSMTSYDLTDPSHLIFKTSRNDYLKQIKMRSFINMSFECNSDVYMTLHKKLLIGLRLLDILKRTQIRTMSDKTWGTIIYFELETKDLLEHRHQRSLGFSNVPFILINLNGIKCSLGSFRNIWRVKRKRREMVDFFICDESIISANQTKMILSSKLLEINVKYIEEFQNKLLRENKCDSIDEYFKKIISILKDVKYVNNLMSGKEKMEGLTLDELFVTKSEVKSENIKLMNSFQKIVSLNLLKQEIFDKEIYLPCFIDNRGRLYFGTLISPTFYKLFRYLYDLTPKKPKNLENSKFYKKIINYKNEVTEFNLEKTKVYFALVLFIEVGKFFVEKKDSCFIKTEDMIKDGIKNYKNKNTKLKFEDLLYVQKIYYIIDKLLENKDIEDTLIFKDATASGLQNYGIILEYKEDMLKYLNIDGDDWCDTYQFLIDTFLNKNEKWENIKIKNNLFKRKYWKNTIMTIPYNAVWFSCFKKFLDMLKEDEIIYKELSLNDRNMLKNTHKEFYINIKNKIKNEFYINKNPKIEQFSYNKWKPIKSTEYKVNYKNSRDKYSDTLYEITEDEKTSARALEANNMHYRDAKLVQTIMKKFEIISIHDCFGIRLSELHLVMDEINEYYSKEIKKETYSIHIIK